MPGFSRSRYCPESPAALAGFGIVSIEKAANAVLTAGDSGYDHILDDQRRHRDAVASLVICDLDVPKHRSSLRVEGKQVSIHGSHEYPIPEHRNASIYLTAADVHFQRCCTFVAPEFPTRIGVHRDDVA